MRPLFMHLMASSALATPAPEFTVTTVATQTFMAVNTTAYACDISTMGVQTGDVIIIAAVNGNITSDQTFSASGNQSGAATTLADLFSSDTYDTNMYVGMLKVGATPDTTITVNYSISNRYPIIIKILRSADQTTQLDVAVVTATGSGSSRPDPGAITPITPGAMILAVYGAAKADSTGALWTAPANLTNFVQYSDVNRPIIGMGEFSWFSGIFNPASATGGPTSATDSWAAVTLAIRPGAAVQTYGPELVSNGTFDTTTTGWGVGGGATLSIVGGTLKVNQTGSTDCAAIQTLTTEAGKTYRVKYDATAGSQSPLVRAMVGSNTQLGTGGPGTNQEFTFVATTTAVAIQLYIAGAGYATFDNVSVKEVL